MPHSELRVQGRVAVHKRAQVRNTQRCLAASQCKCYCLSYSALARPAVQMQWEVATGFISRLSREHGTCTPYPFAPMIQLKPLVKGPTTTSSRNDLKPAVRRCAWRRAHILLCSATHIRAELLFSKLPAAPCMQTVCSFMTLRSLSGGSPGR